ncbi:MAG: TonB-dependent receptor, partial [Terriglobus sp.]
MKQNQYGANLSGPIWKNKAFFFFSWERESVITASPVSYRVPTRAELNGDFSSSFGAGVQGIYDPITRSPYANNNIASKLNATALKIVQLETPDQSRVNQNISSANPYATNFTASAPIRGLQQQFNARVDYNIGKSDQLFARYTYWDPHNEKSDPMGNQTGSGTTGNTTNEGVIGDTHIFNATTVGDIRASYLKNYNFQNMLSLGYNMSNISPTYGSIQSQSFGKIGTLPGLGIGGYGIGAQTSQLYWDNTVWAISGSLNKTLGRHSLKMGGNWRQSLWTSFGNNGGLSLNSLASYTASPSGANGNALASFLLNAPSSASISTILTQHAFLHSYAFYLADTFQATPKLTLTAGIRWEQPGAYSETNDLNTVLLPNVAASVGGLNAITNPVSGSSVPLTGQAALVNSSAYPSRREEALHWNLFSPRVGFAYRVDPQSVIRGGYGISYLPAEITQDGPQLSQVGRAITTVTNTPGTTSSATLTATVDNPLPNGVKQPLGHTQAAINAMLGYGLWGRVPNQAYGYAQQWNLAVEHAFGSNTTAMVAYAGAKGTHLVGSAAYTSSGRNLNQIPTQYAGRTDLLTPVANPFYGMFGADSPLYGPTVPKGYLLLPHPQYPQGMLQQAPRFGASSYNALQASLTHRFNHGGIVQAAYTYAKLMSNVDNTSAFLDAQGGTAVLQDNYNTQAEWSRSAQDLTNNLVINYGIDLPFGHGQMYASHVGGFTNAVIGGWRVNGITTLKSGTPIALVAQSNTLSSFGGGTAPFGLGAGIIRPNYTAGCKKMPSGPARTTARAKAWFNTNCFTQPGDTSFGNESRVDADLKTMGTVNFDFSANKNFDITELVKLRFSGEIFNLFNRAQFAGPGSTVGGGGYGTITHQANS